MGGDPVIRLHETGPNSGPNPGPIYGSRVLTRRLRVRTNERLTFDGMDSEAPTYRVLRSVFGALSWRRGWESNPRIKVLQTSALPLGYRAPRKNRLGPVQAVLWPPHLSASQRTPASAHFAEPLVQGVTTGIFWSGRRDSNPRHRPWQGRTLPTELLPPARFSV